MQKGSIVPNFAIFTQKQVASTTDPTCPDFRGLAGATWQGLRESRVLREQRGRQVGCPEEGGNRTFAAGNHRSPLRGTDDAKGFNRS